MRGAVLGSILVAVVACGPTSKPPVDPSNADDSSNSGKSDMPAETWGSSETASNATSKPTPSSPVEKPDTTPGPATSTPGDATPATPAAPTDSGPHVPATLGGASYDRKTLEVGLKRAARQVKANCGAATDENGAATGPWGKTTVTVKLGHNGHSKGGTVPPPFDGKSTGRCAVQAFANLIYAPFAGADTDVDWPVEVTKP
jgi:hypothetical protein